MAVARALSTAAVASRCMLRGAVCAPSAAPWTVRVLAPLARPLATEATSTAVADTPAYTVEEVESKAPEGVRVVWFKLNNVHGSVKKLNTVCKQVGPPRPR
jgi:hypothetical protein